MPVKWKNKLKPKIKHKGFTLLEIMIALAVGVIVIGIGYSLISQVSTFTSSNTDKVNARDDVRVVLNEIAKNIEQSKSSTQAALSSPYVFTLADGSTVSYYYDTSKKEVVKNVNGGSPIVMLQNVQDTFKIQESSNGSGIFYITLDTINKSVAVGQTDTENYNMTVVRRTGRGVTAPAATTTINGLTVTNGSATVSFADNTIQGVTLQDLSIKATLNGSALTLSGLTYDAASRTLSFIPISQGKSNQTLVITVSAAGGSIKLTGGSGSNSVIIYGIATTINGLIVHNGSATVSLTDNTIQGLSLSDFTVTATLDGMAVGLQNLSYDDSTRTFTFTPIAQGTTNKVLQIIVSAAATSKRLLASSATGSILIYSTANSHPGDPYIDYYKNWFTVSEDWNVDLMNGNFSYSGTGYLVIPKDITVDTSQDIHFYTKEGIVIQPNDALRSPNNGHDINMTTDGIIDVHGATLDGKSIIITAKGDVNIKSTKFIGANGNGYIQIITNGNIYYDDNTTVNGGSILSRSDFYYTGKLVKSP